MEKEKAEQRKFKRFTYKPDRCPILECQNIKYKVLNISEGGLKIEIQSNPGWRADSTHVFNGHISLSGGKQLPVSGVQVWIIGSEIGIKLKEPISEKIIAAESDNFQDEE